MTDDEHPLSDYLSPESLKWLYGGEGQEIGPIFKWTPPKLDVSGTLQFKDNLKDALASLGYAPTPLDEIANRFLVNITKAYHASALRPKCT